MKNLNILKAPILNVQRFSLHDGPGIRTTVFFKGCPLSCSWCSNPESQERFPQVLHFDHLCTGCGACVTACRNGAVSIDDYKIDMTRCMHCGKCADACVFGAKQLIGEEMTVAEISNICVSDIAFYRNSGGGVTLSGGEPALYPAFAIALFDDLRSKGIHTAFETCGYANTDATMYMAGKCDLILFDLKTVEEDVAQKYFQRSVTHPLGLLRRLVKAKNDMVIRFAMIPGVNDSIASIESYCSVLAELCPHYPIELLPFHRLGSSKYHAVNRSYDFENTALLTKEQLDKAVTVFQNHNLSIKVLN